jgi:Zn-dependent protease with chaperone function
MFANFIYFIVVLLLFSTYQTSEETIFSFSETFVLFSSLFIIFSSYVWILFHRLEQRIPNGNHARLDHQFSTLQTRLSILAIILLSIDIYALNLIDFISTIPPFRLIPTLQAMVCIAIFIGYLTVIWSFSYAAHQRLYETELSKRSYILSNISFSIPVLLPWTVLSGIADLIQALPFEFTKGIFETPEGQLLYFSFLLIIIAVIGPAIIQKFWGCTPLEEGIVRQHIESVCKNARLNYKNILNWPLFGGRMMTAGVMGLVGKFRYILVTKALLHALSFDELDAVIAHEIGHVKKKHLLFYLVFFAGYIILTYATFDLLLYLVVYSKPIYKFISSTGYQHASVASFLFTIMLIVFFIIYFRFIFGYFMRNFERQADAYAFSFSNSAIPLISTFKKIAFASGQPADKPNWHHFSILERIQFLEKCEKDRTIIKRHDIKIRRSITIFILGLVIAGVAGYQLNFGETGQKISKHFYEKTLSRELKKSPNNAHLLSRLGDLYFSKNDYAKTIDAYERSLSIKPNSPDVINNLAWLYATCEDEKYRHPERALKLAIHATTMQQSPEILDTLAESYFVNGNIEAAIRAEKAAIAMSKKNQSYFKTQLKKFSDAIEKRGSISPFEVK